MEHEPVEVQEPQSERGAVMLTKPEKRDAQLVAAFDEATESDTLRKGIVWVRQRAEQIRTGSAVAA